MTVSDLQKAALNERVSCNFIVSDLSLRPFLKKEGSFLQFKLSDKTGKIDGNIWQNTEYFFREIKNDTVVKVTGTVKAFDGKNQVSVDTMETCTEYNVSDLVACSVYDPEILFKQLTLILKCEVTDSHLLRLVNLYLDDPYFVEAFKMCPGGKGGVHHAYISGLLEHTLSVIRICLSISDTYPFEQIDRQLLVVGAFLHDTGKLESYEFSPLITMTDRGRLLGHLPLGYENFCKQIERLKEIWNIETPEFKAAVDKAKTLIGHLILSHHGSYEFETCRLPMTLEALILSQADNLDANLVRVAKVIDDIPEDWSAHDNLSKRFYFKSEPNT